jgi:transcriptional regulator with XRE-family HTH domain
MNVRELRERRLLTQEQLAVHAGLTAKTVLTAEAGRPVSANTVRRLAAALQTPADQLDVVIAPPKRKKPLR